MNPQEESKETRGRAISESDLKDHTSLVGALDWKEEKTGEDKRGSKKRSWKGNGVKDDVYTTKQDRTHCPAALFIAKIVTRRFPDKVGASQLTNDMVALLHTYIVDSGVDWVDNKHSLASLYDLGSQRWCRIARNTLDRIIDDDEKGKFTAIDDNLAFGITSRLYSHLVGQFYADPDLVEEEALFEAKQSHPEDYADYAAELRAITAISTAAMNAAPSPFAGDDSDRVAFVVKTRLSRGQALSNEDDEPAIVPTATESYLDQRTRQTKYKSAATEQARLVALNMRKSILIAYEQSDDPTASE